MSKTHRQYVVRESALAMLINTVISIAFSILPVLDKDVVPLWGTDGIAVDFVPQTFMICFATTLVATLVARKRVRRGSVSALPIRDAGPLARMPQHAFVRALLIGAAGALIMSPLAAGALHAFGITGLPARSFVIMKALYGAALTLLISPPIVRAALVGMSDGVRPLSRARS